MQLRDNDKDDYKKEQWLEFRLNDELLTAYTIVNDFKEELLDTLELLAYENNCETNDIKIKKIYK